MKALTIIYSTFTILLFSNITQAVEMNNKFDFINKRSLEESDSGTLKKLNEECQMDGTGENCDP